MGKKVFVRDRVDVLVSNIREEMNQNYAYTTGYLQSLLAQAIEELPSKKQEEVLARFERYSQARLPSRYVEVRSLAQ